MDTVGFQRLLQIFQKDKKVATYKFALLRAAIELVQEYPHLREKVENKVLMPAGLLVEKWIFYYFPLLASSQPIPQTSGNPIAFDKQLRNVISLYPLGFSEFYAEYKKGITDSTKVETLITVSKTIYETIRKQPMYYIGTTPYAEFNMEANTKARNIKTETFNQKFLKDNFGKFCYSADLDMPFEYLGPYLIGDYSILNSWAELSYNYARKQNSAIEKHAILEKLQPFQYDHLTDPPRNFYKELIGKGKLSCTWTGDRILSGNDLAVDHVLPFSVAKSNDLWNLLPSTRNENLRKLDRIPTEKIILQQKSLITDYWYLLNEKFPVRFQSEAEVFFSVNFSDSSWADKLLEELAKKCNYLINDRKFQSYSKKK